AAGAQRPPRRRAAAAVAGAHPARAGGRTAGGGGRGPDGPPRGGRKFREGRGPDSPAVPAYRHDLAGGHNELGILLMDLEQWPAAERVYRRALDLYEKLAAECPAVPDYRRGLAAGSVNFGIVLRAQGHAEASLVWVAKAITLLEPLVQQEPRLVGERLFLHNAHMSRAQALDALGRYGDAIKDWERALPLSPDPARARYIRFGRAVSLARA